MNGFRQGFAFSALLLNCLLCSFIPCLVEAKIPDAEQLTTRRIGTEYFLPPEYSPTQAVLVSEIVLEDENGYLLLKALLQGGVEIWLLNTSPTHYNQLLVHLQQVYSLKLSELSRIKPLPVVTQSVWARDWAPLMSLPIKQNHQNILRMLDARYLPQRPVDDTVPAQIEASLKTQSMANWYFEKINLPVSVEGGNIMCTRQICFLSDEVLRQNSQEVLGLEKALSLTQIQSLLHSNLQQEIKIVHHLPYESTGHIDMWAKFLNEDTLLISQVDPKIIANLTRIPPLLRQSYIEIGEFLETQATGIDAAGHVVPGTLAAQLRHRFPELKIVRVPMPLPFADNNEVIFRTYTNSLLVNGYAILPRYVRDVYGRAYPDQTFLKGYEQQVSEAYEQAGFKVIWLEADYLIANGGAWHCATMQVPQTGSQ